MATRFANPVFQSLNDAGTSVTDGLLYFYEQGTTTKQDTYQDSDLTIPNTNPVMSDEGGRMPAIWLQADAYTVVFEIAGETVWSAEIDGTDIPVATDTSAGVVELATSTEMAAGTATDKVPSVQIVTDFIGISGPQVTSGLLPAARLPDPTETAYGGAEIATQAEVNAGTDDLRVVTPLKLATLLGAAGVITDSDLTPQDGYVVIAGGFVVQWITATGLTPDTAGGEPVNWPTTFPTACLQAVGCISGDYTSTTDDDSCGVVSFTTTTVNVKTGGDVANVKIIGVGY